MNISKEKNKVSRDSAAKDLPLVKLQLYRQAHLYALRRAHPPFVKKTQSWQRVTYFFGCMKVAKRKGVVRAVDFCFVLCTSQVAKRSITDDDSTVDPSLHCIKYCIDIKVCSNLYFYNCMYVPTNLPIYCV